MNRTTVAAMDPQAAEAGAEPGPFAAGGEFGPEVDQLPPAVASAALPPPAEEPQQEVLNDGKPVAPRELTWADRIEALETREAAREAHITAIHSMVDQAVEEINRLRAQLNQPAWHPVLTRGEGK